MKKYLFILLAFLSFIPSLPYIFQAWRSSRLDSWDWLFYLLTIPALIWAIRGNKCQKSDWRALFIALPTLGLALTKNFHNVNALSVLGSVIFVWAVSFSVGGWIFAYRLLPCFVLLALGTPSSSYRLAQMLTLTTTCAMLLKILLAAGCFAWIYANKRWKKTVKSETILFTVAVLLSCVVLRHADELYYTGDSYIPAFPSHIGNFYGRSISPDDNTKRFFVTSKVNQYRYLSGEREISVLAVKCGNDVHEIHPASHCLRTSSWVVTEEKIFSLHPDFAVTEIEAYKGNTRALIWVWYSNDEFSTPGFLGFRRRFRIDGNYHTFQISVPITDNIDTARQVLKEFISVLPQENAK
jgi:hypothetical protein